MGIRADRDFYVIIDRHISVILVLDWKHYEYFFIIAFAAAATFVFSKRNPNYR